MLQRHSRSTHFARDWFIAKTFIKHMVVFRRVWTRTFLHFVGDFFCLTESTTNISWSGRTALQHGSNDIYSRTVYHRVRSPVSQTSHCFSFTHYRPTTRLRSRLVTCLSSTVLVIIIVHVLDKFTETLRFRIDSLPGLICFFNEYMIKIHRTVVTCTVYAHNFSRCICISVGLSNKSLRTILNEQIREFISPVFEWISSCLWFNMFLYLYFEINIYVDRFHERDGLNLCTIILYFQ